MAGYRQYTAEEEQWLRENYGTMPNKKLTIIFNERFGLNKSEATIRATCNSRLGLKDYRKLYSDEEKQFLIDNYPNLGIYETAKQFNKKFNRNKDPKTLMKYCQHGLGLHVTDEYQKKRYERSKIGDTYENCRGVQFIKTENGWIPLTHYIIGEEIPEGCFVFHLDEDKSNNDKDNLIVLRNGVQTSLRNMGMWSEHKEITKTAIKWFELKEELQNELYE